MREFLRRPAVRFVRETVRLYFEKRASRASAALVYWLILSLFPLLICLSAFIGSLDVDAAAVLAMLENILPPGLLAVVEDYLGYVTQNTSPAFFVIGAVTAVFFASAAVRSLMDIMSELYGEPGYRTPVRIPLSVGVSLLLLVAIYLSMLVALTSSRFVRALEERLALWWLSALLAMPWLKFLLLFGVVFLLVSLLYLASAPAGRARAALLPGAAAASGALVAASAVFSVFIGMSGRYSLIYGSLASLIILLLWLYLCGNVLILGGIFNCVRDKLKKEKKI